MSPRVHLNVVPTRRVRCITIATLQRERLYGGHLQWKIFRLDRAIFLFSFSFHPSSSPTPSCVLLWLIEFVISFVSFSSPPFSGWNELFGASLLFCDGNLIYIFSDSRDSDRTVNTQEHVFEIPHWFYELYLSCGAKAYFDFRISPRKHGYK